MKTITRLFLVSGIALTATAQAASEVDVASTRSYGSALPAQQRTMAVPAQQVEAVGNVMLIETTNSFVGQCLTDLGVAHDLFNSSDDFSAVDLTGYQHVFLAMDGGLVNDPSVVNIADFANAGGALHVLGGSCYEPYATALNTHLLQNDTANYCWTTVSGSPDSTITNTGSYLAASLPATYDFVNNGASFYQTRPTDGSASEVAVNGDGFQHLLSKSIGSGTLDILTNSPQASYWSDAADYAWGCTVVQNMVAVEGGETGTALFNVTKTFSNGDTGDVEVTLTCNGGLPLTQSFTISGGGPGVTFTVTNLPDAGADCAVTESGGNEGYTADLSACSWTGVTGGFRTCAIENVPEPTAVAVMTVIDSDDPTIDDAFTTTISCDSVNSNTDDNFDSVTVTDTTGDFTANWYADPDGGTSCTVATVFESSAIEPSSCTFSFDVGDEAAGCDVAGTVFFEGIPTLSQYGLALTALLMLGVGFVGMRRFV